MGGYLDRGCANLVRARGSLVNLDDVGLATVDWGRVLCGRKTCTEDATGDDPCPRIRYWDPVPWAWCFDAAVFCGLVVVGWVAGLEGMMLWVGIFIAVVLII